MTTTTRGQKMTYRIEENDPEQALIPRLSFAAVDARFGEEVDTGASIPLVIMAMGAADENHRIDYRYYALGGQEVLMLLGSLRASGIKAFGQGFSDSADVVANFEYGELAAWLMRGGDLRTLGQDR